MYICGLRYFLPKVSYFIPNMKNYFIALTAILSLNISFSSGQTKTYKNEFGFRTENDSYLAFGQDRYYTNGLFISYRRAMDQSKLKNRINKMVWEFDAGQKMYNPYTGHIKDINKIDRPFAAYLYLGGSMNFLYNSENSLKVSLQAGTIGPPAKGKEVQELMHNTAGFYEISGWEWQVNSETGINTAVEYNHFLSRSKSNKTDLTLNSYANIGNTFSGIGAGLTFRTGSINQLFNSVISQSSVSNNAETQVLNDKEFFFYARPMINFVVYDATVQGGMFREDKGAVTFDVKPVVFSQQAGLMYSKKRLTADFSVIIKSREIQSIAKGHQYGSFALYYKFN